MFCFISSLYDVEITQLTSKKSGKTYFDSNHPIEFIQTTYDSEDFAEFWQNYIQCPPVFWPQGCSSWPNDFDKPGLSNVTAVSATYSPILVSIDLMGRCGYVLEYDMPPNLYGPPDKVYLGVVLDSLNSVQFYIEWQGKKSSRMPESYWFSLTPAAQTSQGKWTVDKAGYPIEVDNIVVNGTRHLHDTWGGVTFTSSTDSFVLNSTDAAVVALGDPNPFSTPLAEYGDPTQGIHFNLYNNIWDTNYPLWYPFVPGDTTESWAFTFTVLK